LLRKLKKYRFPLYLGAMLFALSGVLHPLFHMLDDDECRTAASATVGKAASPHSHHDHDRKHHDSNCPVCAGLFSSAEVPELAAEPAIPELPAVYVCILSTPHQPEFAVFRQERAPPVLS
jgi:hypothetical protein